MMVLTDIGNEPDDSQTMVRLMLYSNQIDIEGLIATTSIHHQKDIGVDMIKKLWLLRQSATQPAVAREGIPRTGN